MKVEIYQNITNNILLHNMSIWRAIKINPIGEGGEAESACTIFKGPFQGFWRSQISWLFLIYYDLSENPKKIGFSQSFGMM